MSIALTCGNLNKKYGPTYALRNLDLQLEENVIYGLLGRNGAGKTTLLNIIAGGIFPDYGTIEVRGKKLGRGELPKDFCYVREKNKYFGGARVVEILQYAANFHPNWDWTFAHELLQTFQLDPHKKNQTAFKRHGIDRRKYHRSRQPRATDVIRRAGARTRCIDAGKIL